MPRPASPARAAIGLERWRERTRQAGDPSLAEFGEQLAADPAGQALLAALFGNSPFLAHCAINEPAILRTFLADGGEPVCDELLARLASEAPAFDDTARLMQMLRVTRRRVALTVALADLCGQWPVETVTRQLSRFAEDALSVAVDHLLSRAAAAGDLELADPEWPSAGSGLIVIGMGKLGAGELNYSSDIDLIILYDPLAVAYRGRRSLQDFFVRLARSLVRLLEDRTADGYVFRTDLRLRPDPASTPLAISVNAAEAYYEGMGQNWERAAMIKARPVAGDRDAGRAFLGQLKPFIWRKHLDFAAIQDIHSIKRQIHAVRGHREVAVGGHNIKLGRGGIREIEFFAQTQQLIWGGRDPTLRQPATVAAIRALVAAGRVAPGAAEEMIEAYRFLRGVEHRLQMVEDRQTQTLPPDGPELDALATFLGYDRTQDFAAELLLRLGRVQDHYADLFEESPSLGGPGSLVFTGTDNDPETVRTLQQMGFADGAAISGVVRGWHHGRYRAMRSARARELLTELMPRLLQALAGTRQPDTAFAKFDEFLAGLPAGVQLFSLLAANPALLDLLAEILGGAPQLAQHLSRNPDLLEAVLSQGFFDTPPPAADLARDFAAALGQAADFQDVLDIARSWTKDHQFRIGVRILRNASDGDRAGAPLSDIAETVIAALQDRVETEFERGHGRLPGRGLAVVALGKLGGREMTVASDLDLIFIYDAPEDLAAAGGWDTLLSDGRRPLAPMHYYARLAQRLINALTVPTGAGRLFEVDMRLRPSGNSGPIASNLPGFRQYQEQEAWTWEHMALTRARVIAGDPALRRRIDAALQAILTRPRERGRLARDIAEMRARMAQQHGGDREWDLKHVRGGLVDVEFIAQYLQLAHAADRPEVLATNTTDAFERMAGAGVLDPGTAAALCAATRLWRRLQSLQRLTTGKRLDEASLPAGLKQAFATAGGAADFAELKQRMAEARSAVSGAFASLVEAFTGA
ncbi:MAG: bifunctional [glutamine synthetase] adenylyltransferase/[glutamine synthetase]-adenylyl-L-tyrosine phosphorylase [Dongiaceae bacterium]